MTNHQITTFIFISILTVFWSLLGLFGKSKHSFSDVLSFMLSMGSGMVLLGLGMSWLISGAPFLELATFERYEITLGFIRLYFVGLSILLSMPLIIMGKIIRNFLV